MWNDLQLIGRVGVVVTIPAVLAAGPVGGYLLGAWLDRRWQTAPWAMAVCTVIGGVGSCVEVSRILRWIARFDRKPPSNS